MTPKPQVNNQRHQVQRLVHLLEQNSANELTSRFDTLNISKIRSLVQEQALLNHCIMAFIELGIADSFPSSTNPVTVEKLARQSGTSETGLKRLLRALTSTGIVEHIAEPDSNGNNVNSFCLTQLGQYFRKEHPMNVLDYIKLVRSEEYDSVLRKLPDLIKSGESDAWSKVHGTSFFGHMKSEPKFGAVFNGAMTFLSKYQGDSVIKEAQKLNLFSGFDHIVDVGGGHGKMSDSIKRIAPKTTRFTVQDLPEVIDTVNANSAPGIDFVAKNMFDEVIPGADCYVLKLILHDWNDEECVRILRNIRRDSSEEKCDLFIIDCVVPEDGRSRHLAKALDVQMMGILTGAERTLSEFDAILGRAGFRTIKAVSTRTEISIVHARRK